MPLATRKAKNIILFIITSSIITTTAEIKKSNPKSAFGNLRESKIKSSMVKDSSEIEAMSVYHDHLLEDIINQRMLKMASPSHRNDSRSTQ